MVRNPISKMLQIGIVVGLVLAFTVSTVNAQPAQAASANLVSSGWMPFTGDIYDAQTNSFINLNGLVHIVTRWKTSPSGETKVDISANLPADSVTVTTDTGIPYTASGAGQGSILLPPNPIIPTDPLRVVMPSFWLVVSGDYTLPPNPIRPLQFVMQFDLVFSSAGVLDFDASTVYATIYTEG